MSDVTRILSAIEQGDPSASEHLLPLVYEELRKLAAQKMAQEAPDHTLQATALVHEAYVRLVDVKKVQHWDSRGHFFAAAAEGMRRILIENARKSRALSVVATLCDTTSPSFMLLGRCALRICWLWTKRCRSCPTPIQNPLNW